MTVHVVSNTEANRQNAANILISLGYEINLHLSAAAFLNLLSDLNPGCILLDEGCDAFMSGAELRDEIFGRFAILPLIVAVKPGQISLAVRAMKAGAFGIIEHPFDAAVLNDLIDAAMDRADGACRLRLENAEQERRIRTLTRRESEVLRLMIAGSPNKVSAYHLGISPRTVETYRASVMKKMSCDNVCQLTMLALRLGSYGHHF